MNFKYMYSKGSGSEKLMSGALMYYYVFTIAINLTLNTSLTSDQKVDLLNINFETKITINFMIEN